MNFYEQIIIPPNAHHVELLNVFLIISMLLFIPFTSMILGATFFSVVFNFIGERRLKKKYIRFSKDIMDKLTIGSNAGWGIALVPILSITFVYAQLLYGANVITVTTLMASIVMLVAGLIFIYKYKNTLDLESLFNSFKTLLREKSNLTEDDVPDAVKKYEENNIRVNRKNGLFGVILLGFSVFFFVGALTVASDPNKWDMNFMSLFISGHATVNYIYYLTTAAAITGGGILFFFFGWQGGVKDMSESYAKFVKAFGVALALISTILQMVMLLVIFIGTPQAGLSASVFVYTGLALFTMLLASNFLYAIIRNSELKFASAAFFFMIAAIMFTIIKDEAVLGNVLKPHLVSVNEKAEQIEKEKVNKTMMGSTDINAEELYHNKCGACHSLDKKIVGPPHKDVVPKYNGSITKLKEFILNPVKVDPAYPPMPNPGLKPKEADAIAKYLISKVGGK